MISPSPVGSRYVCASTYGRWQPCDVGEGGGVPDLTCCAGPPNSPRKGKQRTVPPRARGGGGEGAVEVREHEIDRAIHGELAVAQELKQSRSSTCMRTSRASAASEWRQ
jgi:hypothetical protein